VTRDLARAKSALGSVGRVTPLYDNDDPDLMSEDDRAAAWRARREDERLAAAEAAAAEAEALVASPEEAPESGD
jgi:hypothetical protein